MLRRLCLATSIAAILLAADSQPLQNALTVEEKAAGWTSLFDGRSLDHWIDPSKLSPPGDAWTIADGCVRTNAHPRITEDLVSKQSYGDFEFDWEWRISEGGNSGVKYRNQAFLILTAATRPAAGKFEQEVDHALEARQTDRSILGDGKGQIYPVGLEYQMIDNSRHPDAKRGPLYQSAALYSILPATQDATVAVGKFNHSRLIVRGNHVEHWLNGQRIIEADLTSELLTAKLSHRWGGDQSATFRLMRDQLKKKTPITLQNHGDLAWFRNMKIRQL